MDNKPNGRYIVIHEDKIVPAGVTEMFSIFEFEDEPDYFPAFLQIAKTAKSDVFFRNENQRFECTDSSTEKSLRIVAWMAYMRMNKVYRPNYEKYKQNVK